MHAGGDIPQRYDGTGMLLVRLRLALPWYLTAKVPEGLATYDLRAAGGSVAKRLPIRGAEAGRRQNE